MEERSTIRHELVFNPATFNPIPVTIAGVGAGGSAACLLLAKLGISDITICDNQTVARENIGPSLYGPAHVGMPKVEACADIVQLLTGIAVKQKYCNVEELGPLQGVVFIGVDSMRLRKDILYTQCAYPDTRVVRVFEGRMSAHFMLTHSVDPAEKYHLAEWNTYWFPDEEALPALPGCGETRVSVGATATAAATLMVRQFIEWWAYAQGEVPHASNQVRLDLERYSCQAQYW